jgi:transposase-like protein
VVRTMTGPGRAGFNRTAWDLRLQPLPMDTSVYNAPNLDVGPRGPFVLAGTYEVEVEAGDRRVTQQVVVRTDPLMDISPDEQRSRYAFTVALYQLQAAEYYGAVQANILVERTDSAVEGLEALEELADEVRQRVDSLQGEVQSVGRDLGRQNGTLRGWWRGLIGEFDGGPSTQGTMSGPTSDQRRRLDVTRANFNRTLEELDRVIAEVIPALNEILRELGIVEIDVPARGGVDLVT